MSKTYHKRVEEIGEEYGDYYASLVENKNSHREKRMKAAIKRQSIENLYDDDRDPDT